ncbi:MAG: rRNA pseudouridine synthase [Sulfobacillus thermosulfidooxidans]|uniref:Pseudouridine synthase n=1 Tax=Sulfobacillus thermotolerans TaxID=338644 RepID=A0ABM6RQJ9_9FIRM|nr:pseudouridine synthase [Sulfobacillus sp. hq2]AUW93645.1 pseudouridine synthase [Sulfobacillus thermotolerans]POB10892.1 pseudouridine synthase [Sulfobacillus sp. hq2]PSR37075.1 MAG: rRNA pseudouridine synthase [Sulfobacillus thermosulfidooxidans]
MPERLQKIIAQAGLCSRREAEEWIAAGRVQVNHRTATLGESADVATDQITVDGRLLKPTGERWYLAINKPVGYTTSLKDRHAEHLITELIPKRFGRMFPVGRLDRDTSGLILVTNDGYLAHRLMHPSYHVPKIYEVWIKGIPGRNHVARIEHGIELDDGVARPQSVQIIRSEKANDRTLLRLTLTEGRKREVRRIFEAIGHPVLELRRVAFGPLSIEGLEEGRTRPLTHREVKMLYSLVEKPPARYAMHRRDDDSNESGSGFTRSRSKRSSRPAISTPKTRHSVSNTRGNSGRPHR